MIQILLYYLILPFLAGALLIRYIKKHAPSGITPEVTALLAVDPIEKKFYRAARKDEGKVAKIADYETHVEAVDAIYAAKEAAQKQGVKTAFIVLNDQGETLDWIDS